MMIFRGPRSSDNTTDWFKPLGPKLNVSPENNLSLRYTFVTGKERQSQFEIWISRSDVLNIIEALWEHIEERGRQP